MEAIGAQELVVVAAFASSVATLGGARRRRSEARAIERRVASMTRRRQAYLASTIPKPERRRIELPVGAGASVLDDVRPMLDADGEDSQSSVGLAA